MSITLDDGYAFNFSGPGVQALSVRNPLRQSVMWRGQTSQSDHEVFKLEWMASSQLSGASSTMSRIQMFRFEG